MPGRLRLGMQSSQCGLEQLTQPQPVRRCLDLRHGGLLITQFRQGRERVDQVLGAVDRHRGLILRRESQLACRLATCICSVLDTRGTSMRRQEGMRARSGRREALRIWERGSSRCCLPLPLSVGLLPAAIRAVLLLGRLRKRTEVPQTRQGGRRR